MPQIIKKIKKIAAEKGMKEVVSLGVNKVKSQMEIKTQGNSGDIQNNKVVFLTFTGDYNCNPKWICEALLRKGADIEYIWGLMRNTDVESNKFPNQVKPIRRSSSEFNKHLFSAKVIVDNGINLAFLGYKPKEGQVLIETWHGSLGIKRFDASTNKDKNWIEKAKKEGEATTFAISNSLFEDKVFEDSFWKDSKILRLGHARNDILLNDNIINKDKLNEEFRKRYKISMDARMCMYAPTFRDDGDLSPYKLDYDKISNALEKRFGGKWVILSRFHWRTKELFGDFKMPDNVINVSDYNDIQEIMCLIDAGITDYSSWICEYVLRRKPGFIFATDMDTFEESDRAFFFPLDYMPFPVSKNEDGLIKNIEDFDEGNYLRRCDEFLDEMGSVDDGHAGEKIASLITDEIMKG